MDAPPFFVTHSEIETSPTNFQRFVSGIDMNKSLITMRNRIGPSLVEQFSNQYVMTNTVKGF